MNSKNDHPIDAFTRNILADAQVEPREELWAAISAGVAPPAKRKGGILPWLWIPAVAAVIGLLLLFTLKPSSKDIPADTAVNDTETSQPFTPTPGNDQKSTSENLATSPESEPETAPSPLFGNGDREGSQPGRDQIANTLPVNKKNSVNLDQKGESVTQPIIQEYSPALVENTSQHKTLDPAPNEEPKTSNPFILREQMLQTPISPFIKEKENVAVNEWNENGRDEKIRRGNGKWKLGGLVAPEYAFASGKPDVPADYPAAGAAPVDANGERSLSPTTAFSTGLRAEYAVSERIGLQSGLFYTNRKGQAGGLNSLNYVSNSPVSSESALFYQTEYNYHFMEIPLALKYNLLVRPKWNFFVSSGLSGNFFMSYTSKEEFSELAIDRTETVTNPFRPSQLDILVGTGFEVSLTRKLFLNLEPGLSVAAVTSNYSFAASRPISLTFNTGLNFGL